VVRDFLGEEVRKLRRSHAASASCPWAIDERRCAGSASHLRSVDDTIVEHEEAEKIFLANALGKMAFSMPR
jgi:hypothetical protein